MTGHASTSRVCAVDGCERPGESPIRMHHPDVGEHEALVCGAHYRMLEVEPGLLSLSGEKLTPVTAEPKDARDA